MMLREINVIYYTELTVLYSLIIHKNVFLSLYCLIITLTQNT